MVERLDGVGPPADLAHRHGPRRVFAEHAAAGGLVGVVALGLGQEPAERLDPQPERRSGGGPHPQLMGAEAQRRARPRRGHRRCASTSPRGSADVTPASTPPTSTATPPDDRARAPRARSPRRGGRRPLGSHRPDDARQRRQPTAERTPAGGERPVVGPELDGVGAAEHPRRSMASCSGVAGAPVSCVMRVPSLSSRSITPSTAAWISQATLCSGRTSSRSTMPPCAGEMPAGGANSMVDICCSSVAVDPHLECARRWRAHAGPARRLGRPGGGGASATASAPVRSPRARAEAAGRPGSNLRSATARSRRAAARRRRRRPGRPSRRSRVPARRTSHVARTAATAATPAAAPAGRKGLVELVDRRTSVGGAGRGGCRVERGALHALDRHALVGIEPVDGHHDVPGLDLADRRTGRRPGRSRRRRAASSMSNGVDEVDLDLVHDDVPPGADGLPVDDRRPGARREVVARCT